MNPDDVIVMSFRVCWTSGEPFFYIPKTRSPVFSASPQSNWRIFKYLLFVIQFSFRKHIFIFWWKVIDMLQQWKGLNVLHIQPSGQNRWLRDQMRWFKCCSRYVCLVLRLPLWLSWRPDEPQRSSRKHLWRCENTTSRFNAEFLQIIFSNNVLGPWCWRNKVSWRFDSWPTERTSDGEPVTHSAVWLQTPTSHQS